MKNQARIFTWCGVPCGGKVVPGCLQPCHVRTWVGAQEGQDSGHPLSLAFPRTCVSCEQDFADLYTSGFAA